MDTPNSTSLFDPEGALSKAQSAYESSQNELLQKLIDRQEKKDVPWFSLAGALLRPTRTGSFGESLGSASDVLGQWQEQQKKDELPNAQMRAQVTKSILDSAYDKTAMNALAKITGMQPTDVASTINNGQMPPLSTSQFTQLQSMVPLFAKSPTYGPIIKTMVEFQNQNTKNDIERQKLEGEINSHDKQALEFLSNYNLNDPSGLPLVVKGVIETLSPKAKSLLMPTTQPVEAKQTNQNTLALTTPVAPPTNIPSTPLDSTTGGIPTGLPSMASVVPKPMASTPTSPLPQGMTPTAPANLNPTQLAQLGVLQSGDVGPNKNPVTNLRPDLQASPSMTQQNVFAPSNVGPKQAGEASAKLMEETQKSDLEDAVKKAQYFLNQTKDVTNQKFLQAQRLEQLTSNPKIWGILNTKEGDSLLTKAIKVVGQLADEGVGLNLNQFSAKIGLPVTSVYKNAVLNDTDKQQLAEALRILSSMRVQTAKEKPFGAAPSNFEDKIQLGAMPSEADLPKTVAAYAREQQLIAKYLESHNAGLYADKKMYEDQFKSPYPFRYYFDPNRRDSPFNVIENKYLRDRQALYKFLDKEYGVK